MSSCPSGGKPIATLHSAHFTFRAEGEYFKKNRWCFACNRQNTTHFLNKNLQITGNNKTKRRRGGKSNRVPISFPHTPAKRWTHLLTSNLTLRVRLIASTPRVSRTMAVKLLRVPTPGPLRTTTT